MFAKDFTIGFCPQHHKFTNFWSEMIVIVKYPKTTCCVYTILVFMTFSHCCCFVFLFADDLPIWGKIFVFLSIFDYYYFFCQINITNTVTSKKNSFSNREAVFKNLLRVHDCMHIQSVTGEAGYKDKLVVPNNFHQT